MFTQAAQRPLISVLIPTFNRDKFICQAIESILVQDWRPLEIIVMDDGSNDNTGKLVSQYDSNIVHYSWQENQGEPKARNEAFSRSHGDYIACLDSDDYYLPGKLAAQMNYLSTHPECDIVFTGVQDFFDTPDAEKNMNPQIYKKITFGGTQVYHATMLARRSLIERVGPRMETLKAYDDHEYLYRMYFVHNVDLSHCLPEVYLMRRLHEGGDAYTKRSPQTLKSITDITNKYMRQRIMSDFKERAKSIPR